MERVVAPTVRRFSSVLQTFTLFHILVHAYWSQIAEIGGTLLETHNLAEEQLVDTDKTSNPELNR